MKSHPASSPRFRDRSRAVLRVSPVAVAAASLLMGAVSVQAQSTDPAQTVIVTGIRRAIETAVAAKRGSDQVVEAVSAEDLGKLPDTSIAESLARLPGLTAQRVEGRDQNITIRGLAPKFAVTLLNGREIVSTGDNRSVEYDQFPSELINGAMVYKTPDAALGAQGLAGTINLQTLRPLDFRGRQANINARVERNANGALVAGSSATGNRISASYVDQFANNTIGLALGFAHLDSPGQQQYFKSWWWGNTAIWGGSFPGLDNKTSSLQGFDTGVTATSRKRDGVMAVLEFRPNKDLRSQVDLYYSKFDQTAHGRELQADLQTPSWSGAGIGPNYTNPGTVTMNGDKVLVSGSMTNVDPLALMRYNKREDKIVALGWNTELKLGAWKTTADLAYSKAERNETVAELLTSATTLSGFSNFALDTTGSGFSQMPTTLDFSSASVMQLRGYGAWGNLNGVAQAGSLSPIAVDDELKSLRLSGKRDLAFSVFSSFEGGVNFTDRSKETVRTQQIFALKNGTPCVRTGDLCAPIPSSILQSPAEFGFNGNAGLISFNVPDALASGVYNSGPTNLSSAPGRIWGVSEQISTIFGKAGLEFNAVVPWRGNLGLQVVRAKQESTGVLWDSKTSSAIPMSLGTSYTDVLPSLNLVGELNASTLLRFGMAKVLARPNLDDMRAGFSAAVATSGATAGTWSGSGGNPLLEPWRARSIDLSLEKYFGKRSYAALAMFHKELKNSIYVADIPNFDFSGFPNNSGITPTSNLGKLTAPTNGQGGFVKGYEMSAAIEGALVDPVLDGFGMLISYSNTSSNVPGRANNGRADLKRPLEGLSGEVYSLTGYYEKNGWQFRLAQRYRSAFVAEVRGVWIDTSMAAIEAERITDAQIGYSWESGALKGLSVLFQVNNLTDTPYRTSLADDSSTSKPLRMMPERYYTYGRKYLFGVNYKL